jgi:hypothetical protein
MRLWTWRIRAGRMLVVLAASVCVLSTLCAEPASATPPGSSPVLVELFTSEGCSSCPPADDLLAEIEKKVPNAIVLSEHVTYWNNGGWQDPFSSEDSTIRQADYVDRMGLSSSYTPQMVVGGRYEFVGSDARAAAQAILRASNEVRVPVGITDPMVSAGGRVTFAVETGTVQSSSQLFVVVAQDEGTKHVSNGENGGHTLRHVQIARSFLQAAKLKSGASYSGRLTVELPEAIAGSGWHLVVFLEQGRGGPILGAASVGVSGASSPSVSSGE